MIQRACRVFISHSAHAVEEPLTQSFLSDLCAAIAAVPDFEPLVDQTDLEAGDVWVQRLYTWMGLCDAAVILLSPRAVNRADSVWVPRETNLLLWRKSLDERFVVIPVFIGGAEVADLRNNPFLADAGLCDLQFAKGLTDADKIPRIVEALQEKLAAQRTCLAFDPLRTNIEDSLERYAPSKSIDQALLKHFGTDPWQPKELPAQKLALHLLRRAGSDQVDNVIDSVITGGQAENGLGTRLFEPLYPMRLPAEQACRLMALCHKKAGCGSVLVNTRDPWVLHMLLRAASGSPVHDFQRNWAVLELPDDWGDDDLGEIKRYLAEQISVELLGTGSWEELARYVDPAVRLEAQIAELKLHMNEAKKERRAPVVVCAAYRDRWLELAPQLATIFPTVAFVFWTGAQLPAMPQGAIECAALEPALPIDESSWKLNYKRTAKRLGGTRS